MNGPQVNSATSDVGRPRARHRLVRTIAGLVFAVALAWHARETFVRFSLGDSIKPALPFTVNDHPLHYYYSQITSDFFARRGAFWGYDPHFMAGYAKTMIFPTGCTMPEMIAVVFGRGSPTAFRWWVACAMFAPPFFIAWSARTAAASWGAFVTAFCTSVAWVWCGWPLSYVTWGMAPFIFGITASVLAATVLARWLDEPSSARLIIGGLIASVSTIAHPCSPVILAVMLAPAYVARARELTWRRHCLAWLVPVVAIVGWSPWWLPALRLRETFGSTESFVNRNITGRLVELAVAQFPEETALIVAALGAMPLLLGIGRARMCALVVGAIAFFGITYFGSISEWVCKIQPGRYTQPLYATLIVLVAVGGSRAVGGFGGASCGRASRPRLVAVAITSCVALVLVGPKIAAYLSSSRPPAMSTRLPADVSRMIEFLRVNTDSSGRILFEDIGELNLGPLDPFQGTRPSALLPLLAPGQYLGGPYLKAHVKTNFSQVGDGKFFGRDVAKEPIDLAAFRRYAELYNIRWAVLRTSPFTERELIARGVPPDLAAYWAAPLARLADQAPELCRRLADFGLLRVYQLHRDPNWAIDGHARVRAALDMLEVSEAAAGADGTLVLSYHWIHTLRSTVPLRPVWREDDPAPFIAVDNPPEQFVIRNGR
jgi:hypothetical protein